MKTRTRILMKYLALLCVLAVLGSMTACNMPINAGPNSPPEEGPPPGEEPFPPDEDFHSDEEPPHGEEPPPGEPPPEEHPPEGEPPPQPEHLNDEESIKQALLAELGWSESELEFSMGRLDGSFAEGGVNKTGEMGGAAWLAAKDHGQWNIVHIGQDLPPCDAVDANNVPPDWAPYCWDEASGNSIER